MSYQSFGRGGGVILFLRTLAKSTNCQILLGLFGKLEITRSFSIEGSNEEVGNLSI